MTDPERSPRLTWADDGAPRSGRFGDVYFSTQDGLAESRAVFLAGCDLPHAWADRAHFTVAELGFGTGLNVVALLDLWTRTRPPGARLSIVSVEGFPLARDEAARALDAWPGVAAVAAPLLAAWPPTTPGFHRIDLPQMSATLDLIVGDVAQGLETWSGRADAWFLDGFSPALNPAMWSDRVMDAIAARSAPDARVATFTVAGAVRRALAARGFEVTKRPGHGRKRERLEARRPGPAARTDTATTDRVMVLGAGIAGASLARAFRAQGTACLVIEGERPGAGASGFPAALVTPRFDLGDPAIAQLYRQALDRVGTLYAAVPDAVLARGVTQFPNQARDADRFARIADQPIWSPGDLVFTPGPEPHLDMAGALAVRPAAILKAWLDEIEVRTGTVLSLARDGDLWVARDADGRELARADAVVIAGGWGTAALAPSLALTPVRGQADWVEGPTVPPQAWGGYVAPTGGGALFGATHRRGRTDTAATAEDTAANRATLAARLPDLARAIQDRPSQARAAVRATTPDRLPVCGAVADAPGLFVLSGLGSRGFCLAPLLAEHLAAVVTRRPSPLPRDVARRLEPDRHRRPCLVDRFARR